VLVFTAAIRVCPSKAGLYCGLLGADVSTEREEPVAEGDFVDEQAATNSRPAAAIIVFIMQMF